MWCVLQLFRAPRGRIQPLSQTGQDLHFVCAAKAASLLCLLQKRRSCPCTSRGLANLSALIPRWVGMAFTRAGWPLHKPLVSDAVSWPLGRTPGRYLTSRSITSCSKFRGSGERAEYSALSPQAGLH